MKKIITEFKDDAELFFISLVAFLIGLMLAFSVMA